MATIKKITKLKNMGVYANYGWTAGFPEFKDYNVIYGWNGTGKTTLSKLLGALNSGNHPEFPLLEYQIQDSDGTAHSQGTAFPTTVRVFSSDFIADHLDFESLSSKTITVVLGKENKEALKAIADDETELNTVKEDIRVKTTQKEAKEKERGLEFTSIAKVIGQMRLGGVSRTYNKTHAEQAFAKLTKKELLDEDSLTELRNSVEQTSLPTQNEPSPESVAKDLSSILDEATILLSKTVEASVIQRLKDNADISEWVEEGIKLHDEHKSENCEFCGKPFDATRLAELTAHFNEADAKLKTDVDALADRLVAVYGSVKNIDAVDKMNIYQELRDDYATKLKIVTDERDNLLEAIKSLGEQIRAKKLHTTEKIEVKEIPNTTKLVDALKELNAIIAKHNKKTNNFMTQQKTDSEKIERHHLSTIYDKVQVLDDEIKILKDELTALSNGNDKQTGRTMLLARIAESKAKVSSSHKACELLSISLKKFLGHDEITFEVNDDDTGYKILRLGDPAKSLSEGERTAIAFIFFVTQLQDDSFDPKTGIIVVDDPVSSLDANSQFQAFAFLKEATKDASQLFIFTHNFDFLKLVTNWVKNAHRGEELFMIKNIFSEIDGSRTAYIDKLDKALRDFESEYHYLFNIAYKYKDDGSIENAYKMPNIARKLLDTFLMFRVPKNVNSYKRLEEIKYDEQKKSAIYKFSNDQSHITGSGFDPSLVPEAKNCIKDLLDMMKAVDPEHYRYLEETVSR
jgi:wobble nucleotide-excising tRNase